MHRSLPVAALTATLLALPLVVPPAASAAPWSTTLQPVSTSVSGIGLDIAGGEKAAIDVAPDGRAAAAWIGIDSTLLVARRAPDQPWSAPQVVSGATTVRGVTIDLGIDDAGQATVVWAAAAAGGTPSTVTPPP